jgi:hypothetical protein
MNYQEVLNNIKRLDENKNTNMLYPFIEFLDLSHLNFKDDEEERLLVYAITEWRCTDTHVGFYIAYLDDNPICFLYKPYRRADYSFYWLTEDRFNSLKDFIESLKIDESSYDLNIINLDDETLHTYTRSHLFGIDSDTEVYYEDNKVEIVDNEERNCTVLLNGEEKFISINKLVFKHNMLNPLGDDCLKSYL